MSDAPAIPPRLFLYDGVCGMCNQFVQTMISIDRNKVFQFAPLQGETTAALKKLHPEIPEGLDTIVYIEEGKVFLYSDGLLTAARHLPAPWSWGRFFLLVPKFIRNPVYKFIASQRYKIWGKYDSCRIPSPEEMARFME